MFNPQFMKNYKCKCLTDRIRERPSIEVVIQLLQAI